MPSRTSLIPGGLLQPFHSKKLKIGILHGGGPAPGGNQVLYAASLRAKDYGLPVMAFFNGYQHLMNHSFEEIAKHYSLTVGRQEIRYLRDQDSLVIGTARANPGKAISNIDDLANPEKTEQLTRILHIFDELQIGALISVGGDDTMRTANLLQTHLENLLASGEKFEHFHGVVHVPKTIDKDYPGIDFTFGFMSAAQAIGDRVKALHDDAKATATESMLVYHVVEIMGRAAGWLCAAASVFGQSTYAIVPEDYTSYGTITLSRLAEHCVDVILTRKYQGKNYGVITIAEGISDLIPDQDASKDEFGHTRFDEVELAFQLRRAITHELAKRSEIKLKIHSRPAGYDARQVRPNIFDILLCQRLGVSAVDAILEGQFGHMVSVEGVFNPKLVPFTELFNPVTLKVKPWVMAPHEGLYKLMLAMQQPFRINVDKKQTTIKEIK